MQQLDYHCHSRFSADSKEEPRAHVLEAIQHGLTELCFTEHRDFYFPGMAFDLNVSAYFDEVKRLQEEFSDQITLKFGLEMGLDVRYKTEIEKFVASSPFDFVIGSVHEINDIEVYNGTPYYQNKSKEQAHLEYLNAVLTCVKAFDCFNSLGHLDYVARYGPYYDKAIQFENFSDLIGQILQVLVDKDQALEVNTRLFESPKTQAFYQFLLKTYKNLGGRWITLGTDSHVAARDWNKLSEAQRLIQNTGFSDLTRFKNMKPLV